MDPLPDAEYVEFNDMLLPKWKENISFIHTVALSELSLEANFKLGRIPG